MTTPRTPQAGGSRPPFRRGGRRRRQCFCKETTVDYKDVSSIRRFITDRGRIEAGKKSGNCAKCQRNLTTAIKRARHLALLPYAPGHTRVTGAVAANTKVSDEEEETTTEESTETTEAAVEATDAPQAEAAEQTESEETEETETVSEDVSSEESEEAPESESESESDSDEEEK